MKYSPGQTILNKFGNSKIIEHVLRHNRTKLEISHRNLGNPPNTQKLSNMKIICIEERIAREIGEYFKVDAKETATCHNL